jgi:hypothetical protein
MKHDHDAADIQYSLEPSELTPQQRFSEIAAILARGILRRQKILHLSENTANLALPESPMAGLDVPPETVLTGDHGFGGSPNKTSRQGAANT